MTGFHEYNIYQIVWHIKLTAQGSGPIPYRFLKHCAVDLAPIITHLYSLILTSGVSPDSFQLAIVTPIPKITPVFIFGSEINIGYSYIISSF